MYRSADNQMRGHQAYQDGDSSVFAGIGRPISSTNEAVRSPVPAKKADFESLRRDAATARPTSNRLKAAYVGVLLFSIVYFGRPEDWIPGAAQFPFAKITGAIAILAFILSVGSRSRRLPKEMWLLIALFAQLVLAIPFSSWRGGSFDVVFFVFSKIVIITLVMVQCITTLKRLRLLILIHTLAVCAVSVASLFAGASSRDLGRLTGAVGGIFGYPNDLAASISLVFPFALVFLMLAKNPVIKALWLLMVPLLSYTLVKTYSRGGFLSMLFVVVSCLLFLTKKQTRSITSFVTVMLLVGAVAVAANRYQDRIVSIVNPTLDETGSYLARNDLLLRSIELAATHPIFGIGPGQFAEYSKNWHAAHNSYTEFAAEAGLPAGILFVWMLGLSFKNLVRFRRQEGVGIEAKLFAGAVAASMVGFFVTLFFSSVEYLFFPYFLVGYACALVLVGGPVSEPTEKRIALNPPLMLEPHLN